MLTIALHDLESKLTIVQSLILDGKLIINIKDDNEINR